MPQRTTPVTVFTGFLGSGKTTIISHLIDELQSNNIQVLYIKNEIGSENIDSQLLQGKHIQTKELLNGCICCTLVGPFIHAIDEIIEQYSSERIIIEASGAADPAALALMIDSHPKLKRDGVLSIIDVVNFQGYSELSITAQNQTKFTDLIVFNKVELVDLARKQAVVGYVRELNSHSPIVEAAEGKVAPQVVFGIHTTDLDKLLIDSGFTEENIEHSHHPHEHHLEQDGIDSFTLEFDTSLNQEQISHFMQNLPREVYRVKGICKTPTHMLIINKVGTRIDIESTDQYYKKNVLVLIGFQISHYKDELQEELASLTKNNPS